MNYQYSNLDIKAEMIIHHAFLVSEFPEIFNLEKTMSSTDFIRYIYPYSVEKREIWSLYIAGHPDTPSDLLDKMYLTAPEILLKYICLHPNLSFEAQKKIMTNEVLLYSLYLVRNPNLKIDINSLLRKSILIKKIGMA